MVVTLYPHGYLPQLDLYHYTVLCDNGVVFDLMEPSYFSKHQRLSLHDDMCQIDSGWIEWECDKCRIQHWTRTRPGGIVQCPCCSYEEICPEYAIMLPYEGATTSDIEDDLY